MQLRRRDGQVLATSRVTAGFSGAASVNRTPPVLARTRTHDVDSGAQAAIPRPVRVWGSSRPPPQKFGCGVFSGPRTPTEISLQRKQPIVIDATVNHFPCEIYTRSSEPIKRSKSPGPPGCPGRQWGSLQRSQIRKPVKRGTSFPQEPHSFRAFELRSGFGPRPYRVPHSVVDGLAPTLGGECGMH